MSNSAAGQVPSAGGGLLPNQGFRNTGQVTLDHATLGLNTTYYSASGAIVPAAGCAVITKATAAAMTLAAPTQAQDGAVLVITSRVGTAHTVTGVALLADGASGAPHSTATYVAAVGASMTLLACNQLWNVIALQNVSVA